MDPCKLAVMLVAVAGAGCSGGGAAEGTKVVQGTGYTFSAPASWQVVRTARQTQAVAGKGSLALVAVSRLPLRRDAGPELASDVVADLDRAADQLARQHHGSRTDSVTERIAGRDARRYKVAYDLHGAKLIETVAFVLRGKTEFLLLCRYEQSQPGDACNQLLHSFRLI
jgi:hypothetical protein